MLGVSDQPAARAFSETLNYINGLRANHALFGDNIIVIFVENCSAIPEITMIVHYTTASLTVLRERKIILATECLYTTHFCLHSAQHRMVFTSTEFLF